MTTIRTLVIVLCETREIRATVRSLDKHVLKPLEGKLSFCAAFPTQELSGLKFDADDSLWIPEPSNWSTAFSEVNSSERWKLLLDLGLGRDLLGGASDPRTVGSGGIIMWFRTALAIFAEKRFFRERFDWFAIVRSDFFWEFPLPTVAHLDPRKIYFLDGERYGGLSDRFMLFNKIHAEQLFGIADDLFLNNDEFLARVRGRSKELGENLNPERYISLQMEKLGLTESICFLPYNGWSLRHESTSTRWSTGLYSKKSGLYVKYPLELLKARIGRALGLGSQRERSKAAMGVRSIRRRFLDYFVTKFAERGLHQRVDFWSHSAKPVPQASVIP